MRVLDLSRVIAGPVAGRTLAVHGADVLLISGPDLPAIPWLTIDTGRGKLATFIDLKSEQGRGHVARSVRAGRYLFARLSAAAIASLGFSPEEAARINPGIVYVSLSAYGHAGPWAERRGFDSLVQTTTGFNHAEGQAAGIDGPKELPAQMLDHATGYLMAFGAMMAKARQSREGGSWHVRVSLAQTGRWLWNLGRVADGLKTEDLKGETVRPFLEQMAIRLRSAARRQPCGDTIENAGALGAARDAARQPPAAMAGAWLRASALWARAHKSCPLRLWLTLPNGCPLNIGRGRKPRESFTMRIEERQNGNGTAAGTSDQILGEIRDYCRATQTAESTFGRLVVNDGKLVSRLRDGAKITTGTLDKVRAYLSRTSSRAGRARKSIGDDQVRQRGVGSSPTIAPPGFRFFDNRQKYLLFVSTCSEKTEIANRISLELGNLQPSPPALRLFDAGVGDGTVLSRVMRSLHARFPTMPLYVVAKEISYEDVRMMLEKMADRLFEHPATVLVVTNLYYAEAPWLTPRSVTSAQGLIWKDVTLSGNTAHGFAEQIGELEGFLAENWRAGISQKTGNPVYTGRSC